MTAGARFYTQGLTAQLDNNKIVPQMVLRVDMATQDQFDIPTDQPGWNIRLFRWEIPSWLIGRPYIGFFSIPDQGYEVYGNAFYVAYQAGQPFVAPVLYVFALDYVTYSSSDHGMRLWMDNGGPLVYDAANFHLNIRNSAVISVDTSVGSKSLNYPTGGTNSFNLALPASTAIFMPQVEIFRDWGIRFGEYGQMRAHALSRKYGGTIQTKMFTIEAERHESDASSANYDHLTTAYGAAVQLLVLDRTMYD